MSEQDETIELVNNQKIEFDKSKPFSEREKKLLLRDLQVRGNMMELKATKEVLSEQNKELVARERNMYKRDLELRTALLELKAIKKELAQKNDELKIREKELLVRDLEVRSYLMEIKVVKKELDKQNEELIGLLELVKAINRAESIREFISVLLSQSRMIFSESTQFGFLQKKNNSYLLFKLSVQDGEQIKEEKFQLKDMEEYLLKSDWLIDEGMYYLNNKLLNSAIVEKLHLNTDNSILCIPITENQKTLEGIFFLDLQRDIIHSETNNYIPIAKNMREHTIAAFTKLHLLQTSDKQKNELETISLELQTAIAELHATQDQLILSEKLAALGQLVSTMAHELNNPIGAINAASTNVLKFLPEILTTLIDLLSTVDKEVGLLMLHTIRELDLEQIKDPTFKEREERQKVFEHLSEMGIMGNLDVLSKHLIKLNIHNHSEIEKLKIILEHPKNIEIVKLIYSIQSLLYQTRGIATSVEKAHNTVMTYKSFTDENTNFIIEQIDINKSLKISIQFIKDLQYPYLEIIEEYEEPIEPFYGSSEQLSQLWNNLISNALYAMNNKGKLMINTKQLDGKFQISVTDTGKGIDEEILPKIFDPFFTTKGKGEGTGLGLHNCKKIVERHKGELNVNLEPGSTTFIVSLPLTHD